MMFTKACSNSFECSNQKAHNASLHVLIVSYHRTGSSFIGDLIQNYPGVFYHFEPLHFLNSRDLNDSNITSLSLLSKLFRCQVSSIPSFLEWQKRHPQFMKLNRFDKYWKSCNEHKMCYSPTYMDSFCLNHSIVLIKTVRMSLSSAAELLKNYPDLDLKIVYLVRDPRGTFSSRQERLIKQWCRDPLCHDPKVFCARLADDLKIASSLSTSYERNFMLLKFEDISQDPLHFTKSLISFLGLKWVPKIETYLKTHTTNVDKVSVLENSMLQYEYTTRRNSADIATKWQQKLPFEIAIKIQQDCMPVLQSMQYPIFNSSSAMKSSSSNNTHLKGSS